jgi:DNA-binding NtrC family response regulator
MMAYDWPGNVRELENAVGRSMILNQGARALTFEAANGVLGAVKGGVAQAARAREEKWDLERLEREHILAVLEDEDWHQAKASEALGINRRTLHRKLKKYRDEGFLADGRLVSDA